MIDPYSNSNESYFPVLNSISTAFDVKLNISIHNINKQYYSISVRSLKKLTILTDYFNKNTLFSSKYLDYVDFITCLKLMLNNEHLTEAGRAQAKLLKSGMNNSCLAFGKARTNFNWDHLDKLPCQ